MLIVKSDPPKVSFQLCQDQALSASPAQNWDRVVRGSPARRVAYLFPRNVLNLT